MKKVVVVGGGITGLSTLYYLQQLKKKENLDIELVLVEKNEYLGGKIHSVKQHDFIMETGADSIVVRHESVLPLIKDLEIEDQVTYNATGISYIYTDHELHPIPKDTVFGIPTSKESLFSSTLISEEGKLDALKDFSTENTHFTKESSVGEFLEYFLGKELVEKQISPVLSGVYSGKLSELTLASTLPYLLDYKNQYGSIIEGLSQNKEKFQAVSEKKFVSFHDGLSTVINALESKLSDASILKGIETKNIIQTNNSYELSLSNGVTMQADYIVLATPHQVAQELLKTGKLEQDFKKLSNSSLISIYLGFDLPDEQLPADGTGFIVSGNGDVLCNASTWTSRKWAHTSKNRNLLVRLFYKSTNPVYPKLMEMDEEGLVNVALSDIEKSIGIQAKPSAVEVTNWNQLMPNYSLNHSQAIESLNQKISVAYPNIILAGCSYYGVGIGACIQNGKETAKEIVDRLSQR
ncbi:protoporphyrinogen oxidase [Bacillus sp. PS06]|uniref:protoporphyrinogen oxidase n=1 Tax=Bacillus sp. PS06 TaxID=2764176 RepID=UPI00177E6897|nr:protoporphyrinogen oxidase [Bacillus sp. PS06]MBD8069549.1 protoporphyrinogen oxidase [Bacillus sp. PS06]